MKLYFKILKKAVFILLFFATTSSMFTQTFVHPGIFCTKGELDFVKSKIAANEEPWKGAYDRLKASVNTNYVPHPVANIIGDTPKVNFLDDSDQAYNFALLWYFSGNQTYANKAIEIMKGWAIFQTSEKGLDTEWAASDLIPAAEIIEYSNAGWAAADITKFKTMVKTYLIPAINSNKSNLDNRRTTGIRTMLGISVFLDDRKAFNTWIDDWKYYTPIYVLDNGQSKETCRDQHHVVYGLEGVFQGAETAWIQGVDLYGLEKTRLTKFLELFSGWARGTVPIPSNVCSSSTDYNVHPGIAPCRSAGSQYHNPPCLVESNLTFDKVYFHYKNLGVNLPYTLAYNDYYRKYWDRKCLQDYINSKNLLGTSDFSMTNNLKAYPNPAKDIIYIEFSKLTNPKVSVYDSNGRVLFNQNLNNNSNQVDIQNFPIGVYFFKIISDEGTTTSKVVKQ